MVRTARHDPFALFSFALRESDWVLADFVACLLVADEQGHERILDEIRHRSERPGAPDSLATLRRWAELTRELGLDEESD